MPEPTKEKKNGDDKQLATTPPTALNLFSAIVASIKSGEITAENVAAMDGAMKLFERMQEKEAERQFAVAYVALMQDIPQIHATKAVPNNDGTVRYTYAPLEEVDRQLRPIALKHGFSYYFAEGNSENGEVTKLCTVQHVGGHKRTNSFTVRTSGPPGTSTTQADGSTHSYAKRGALCDAFGVVVAHLDDDARLIGKPISKALAEDLQARVKACGANEQAFLKFAGAANFESIPDARFDDLDKLLRRKEMGQGIKNEKGEYTF